LQKSLLCQRSQKLFLKNLPTLQKIKIHRHTAQQTQQRMTLNLNIDKTYNDTMDRRPAGNSRLPQWGLTWLNQMQCFYQHLCLVDSLVLRKPHCGKRQNVMGKFKKRNNGMTQTREPPTLKFDSS
jgi:hypothetical protein